MIIVTIKAGQRDYDWQDVDWLIQATAREWERNGTSRTDTTIYRDKNGNRNGIKIRFKEPE